MQKTESGLFQKKPSHFIETVDRMCYIPCSRNKCMYQRYKRGEQTLKEDKNFFIVDKSVLPEIFLKVMEVKNLLESKKEKTVQDAVNRVGISRSAFYKYKDAVRPFNDMLHRHHRSQSG